MLARLPRLPRMSWLSWNSRESEVSECPLLEVTTVPNLDGQIVDLHSEPTLTNPVLNGRDETKGPKLTRRDCPRMGFRNPVPLRGIVELGDSIMALRDDVEFACVSVLHCNINKLP